MKKTTPKTITVTALMAEWLPSRKGLVKESSYVHYRNIVNNHIIPELGNITLANLDHDTVDAFLKKLLSSGRLDSKGGLSAKSVIDIRSILVSSLKYAQKRNYISRISLDFFTPKNPRNIIPILSKNEQRLLEIYLLSNPCPLHLSILLTLYSGLRIGELCALQWGDISLENGTLKVNKTLLRIQNASLDQKSKTQIFISTPKTECSLRVIPLSTAIIEYIKKFKMAEDIYVLTGTTKWMEPRICLTKYKKALRNAGIPSFSFHALRHTFATRCVEMGFDIKSLSEILGHSNVNITMQRYVHPTIEQKRKQMERLTFLK